jgi:hypothetical protein
MSAHEQTLIMCNKVYQTKRNTIQSEVGEHII